MTRQRCWFPVLGINRDDIEYALGFDPELTDERMEILTAALHDALRKKGFEQLLDDTLDDLMEILDIVVPKTETQPKCLDVSPAADQLLQDFEESLRRIREGITDAGGASFACFPFQFDWTNLACRGESNKMDPNSPVCMLCRELHGYKGMHPTQPKKGTGQSGYPRQSPHIGEYGYE